MKKDLFKKYHVTQPNLITNVYFNFIYNLVSNIIVFNKKKVLDFGGGVGHLKKKLVAKGATVKIYDIVKEISDIDDYKNFKFDIIIFCQVLCVINKKEILEIINFLKKKKNIKIISVFSTQTFLNKLFAFILGHSEAHKDTKLRPDEEYNLLKNNFKIIKLRNYYLFKIFVLKT